MHPEGIYRVSDGSSCYSSKNTPLVKFLIGFPFLPPSAFNQGIYSIKFTQPAFTQSAFAQLSCYLLRCLESSVFFCSRDFFRTQRTEMTAAHAEF